jgi:hypothetical protein
MSSRRCSLRIGAQACLIAKQAADKLLVLFYHLARRWRPSCALCCLEASAVCLSVCLSAACLPFHCCHCVIPNPTPRPPPLHPQSFSATPTPSPHGRQHARRAPWPAWSAKLIVAGSNRCQSVKADLCLLAASFHPPYPLSFRPTLACRGALGAHLCHVASCAPRRCLEPTPMAPRTNAETRPHVPLR